MGYKKLEALRTIFMDKNFKYISDNKKITEIERVIRYNISNPDGNESIYTSTLKKFLNYLTSFYNSINNENAEIEKSFSIVQKELQNCIALFVEPKLKRKSISRGHYKKIQKTFLYGLKLIKNSLSEFLKIDGGISFGNVIFTQYLLDKVVGLGSKYEFDKNIIKSIKRNEFGNDFLNQFYDNLKNRNHIKTVGKDNEWEKYGQGRGDNYRAYGSKKSLFGKYRIYFLIPNNPAIKARMDGRIRTNIPKDITSYVAA